MTSETNGGRPTKLTALVTGASSGIGRAIALRLTARGLQVFGTSRQVGDGSRSSTFETLPLDVRSEQSVKLGIEAILARTGRLDVLVNNAGYALTGAAEETSIEEAQAQFDTNFFGVVRVVNAALPAMRKAGGGKIVNVGSLAGLTAIPFMSFYTATKFALEGYSESLWHELRPFGIFVSLVEPEFVHTKLAAGAVTASRILPEYDGGRRRALAAVDRSVKDGIAPERVAARVLEIVDDPAPRLRYPVGREATWLPRLKAVAPWPVFATGVRRRFLGAARG
jgi:NAD(P)-dependent dehydrogenase (short-subunit alcohol dehydrogenase family)